VQFYERDAFLVEAVARYVAEGLRAGEAAIIIATPEHLQSLATKLTDDALDLEAAKESGQYVACDAAATLAKFMGEQLPDERLFKQVIGGVVQEAQATWGKARAFGEMVALLWADGKQEAAICLEEFWDEFCKEHSLNLFCAYPMDGFRDASQSSQFEAVCNGHDRVIPAETYVSEASDAERSRLIAKLQQKAASLEAEIALRKSAEEDLRRSIAEEKAAQEKLRLYKEIFSASKDGVAIIGADGKYVEQNEAHRALLGFSDEELKGKTPAVHMGEASFAESARILAEEGRFRGEVTSRTKDGKRVDIELSAFSLKDARGAVSSYVGLKRDITDRKREEQLLARRANEQAALYKLTYRLHRATSLTEIYDAALEAIVTALNCQRASVLLFDEQGVMRFVGWRGLSEAYRKAVEGHSPWKRDEREPQPICMGNIELADLPAELKAVVKKEGIGALAFVPLVSNGSLLGKFMMYYDTPHVFTPDELELAMTVARQLCFGVEQKRSEQALRISRAQLEVELSDTKLLQSLSATLIEENNVELLYGKILDAAVAIMRSDMASMQAVDEKENALRLLGWRGFPADFGEVFKFVRTDTGTSCARARNLSQRVIVPDVEKCDFILCSPDLAGHRQAGIRAVQSTPLLTRSGRLVGMISTHWRHPHEPSERDLRLLDILARQTADLLERRLAEEALRQTEERFRAVLDNSANVIYAKDCEGRYLLINEHYARLTGRPQQEWIGKTDAEMFPAESAETFRRNDLEVLSTGKAIEVEETASHADGLHTYLSVKFPLRKSDGTIYAVAGISTDISERKRAEEKLEQAVAERTVSLREAMAQMEEFSYTVSHDLRAPLRGMQVYTEALLQDFAPALPAEARHYLNRIAANATRLDKMILDVLTFSRIARAELKLEKVNVDRLVRQIIEHYPGMQPPSAELKVEPLEDVLGHEPSLAQALSNLLNNAVKFIPPNVKPKVHVWSERNNGHVRLWVQDNGIGINPEYQHRLFGMFERVHPDLNYEGTGVGLAIVRKAVERMGGKVGIESDGRCGSKFWVELGAASK